MHRLHFVAMALEPLSESDHGNKVPEEDTWRARWEATNSEYIMPDWSDWKELGGRWNGIFYSEYPEAVGISKDGNILPFAGNEKIIRQLLETIGLKQNETFNTLRARILGLPVSIAEQPGSILGYPFVADERVAKEITESNRAFKNSWETILSTIDLKDCDLMKTMEVSMVLQSFINTISGDWSPESGFYDSFHYDSSPRYLLNNNENGSLTNIYKNGGLEESALEDMVIVAIDYHC